METVAEKHETHVVVLLNTRSVRLDRKKATGLELKDAAISQGVPIERSFALYKLKGNHQTQITDDQVVHLHDGETFRCVHGDDNS